MHLSVIYKTCSVLVQGRQRHNSPLPKITEEGRQWTETTTEQMITPLVDICAAALEDQKKTSCLVGKFHKELVFLMAYKMEEKGRNWGKQV